VLQRGELRSVAGNLLRHTLLNPNKGCQTGTKYPILHANRTKCILLVSVSTWRTAIRPVVQVALKTKQLRNLHQTVDLLRHIIQRLKLAGKLRGQMAAPASGAIDLAKFAKMLSDIEAVSREADLAGLDAVDASADFLRDAGVQIRAQAQVTHVMRTEWDWSILLSQNGRPHNHAR
jgi:hypothetical protein